MAAEILVVTPAIRALIRDDKIHQIYSMMQSGKKYGMQTMNDALYNLYMSKVVTLEEVLRASHDQSEFTAHDRHLSRERSERQDGGGLRTKVAARAATPRAARVHALRRSRVVM